MQYRITRTRDLDLIQELRLATLPGSPKLTAAELAESTWWLVRCPGGDPAAYAGLHRDDPGEGAAMLISSGVLPEHRGQNLQRRLISVRVREARSLGMGKVWSYVAVHNIPSSRSLFRAGFLPTRVESGFVYLELPL